MRIVKKIIKYCFMISIYIILLFGLKMILPVRDNTNNSIQINKAYIDKI